MNNKLMVDLGEARSRLRIAIAMHLERDAATLSGQLRICFIMSGQAACCNDATRLFGFADSSLGMGDCVMVLFAHSCLSVF
jgi:hypothetical protein